MNAADLERSSPEDIERQIGVTRRSLDDKVAELQRRLSPRERLRAFSDDRAIAWAAAGAVAVGACMAITGWRRARTASRSRLDDEVLTECAWW